MLHALFIALACYITAPKALPSVENTWITYRTDVTVNLTEDIAKDCPATIACDTRYWLWINGQLAVFEGSLKRGPNPKDSYYDVVNLGPYLKDGQNQIAILQCYFGRSAFSHIDSGYPVLLFDAPAIGLESSEQWKADIHPSYGKRPGVTPNFRLSESCISFDERLNPCGWQTASAEQMPCAQVVNVEEPLGKLVRRPIPLFKDYGIRKMEFTRVEGPQVDTVKAMFPYDIQMTPIFTVEDSVGGNVIVIETNHARMEISEHITAQYITAQGTHTYESLGWMNGEEIALFVPKGVKITDLSYRETGFDTVLTGSFTSSDPFFNEFWKKGARTIFVNMRDTFYDCPDRERAQWWGDLVVLMGQCAYMYDANTQLLVRKGIHELCDWQRADGTLHSPIPGNYNKELPCQMLAAVGKYGFWTYYMNTGDKETLEFAYPHVKRYLDVWSFADDGLVQLRTGEWTWGDWGKNIDMRLLQSCWLSLAYEGAANMARELGYKDEAKAYLKLRKELNAGIAATWNGHSFRSPEYQLLDDDRCQAMAVLCGAAGKKQYPAILTSLKEQQHASPYMEKYVCEALFDMGYGAYAMERVRSRYDEMITNEYFSTLWEGWHKKGSGFGTNHAWGGGVLTVIASKLMGVSPAAPGWTKVKFAPQPTWFESATLSIVTPAGPVTATLKDGKVTIK